MAIPTLKKITINSAAPEILRAQLDQIDFRSRPHILSLHAVADVQEACLDLINEYFSEYPQKLLPYPPYVLTSVQYDNSLVRLIKSEDQLPRFFKIKERPLNHRETNLLNRIELVQKNFSHLNLYETQPIFEEYATHQRDIKRLQSELDYLTELSQKLEEQRDS